MKWSGSGVEVEWKWRGFGHSSPHTTTSDRPLCSSHLLISRALLCCVDVLCCAAPSPSATVQME